jgi:hypothetical protein
VEVRDQFSKVLNDPAHLDAQSRDIAAGFLNSHRTAFPRDAWDEVTINGLVGMMGGLRKRRRRADGTGKSDTPDLFAGFNIDPIVVVHAYEEGKGVVEKNKSREMLTLPEARDYLDRHSKERIANAKMIAEWRRLIRRVTPFMTQDGMTLADGLKFAAEADAKKAIKAITTKPAAKQIPL